MKKLNRPLSPQSDHETKRAYKDIQKGGDVPIGGLGIPYPEKKGMEYKSKKMSYSVSNDLN